MNFTIQNSNIYKECVPINEFEMMTFIIHNKSKGHTNLLNFDSPISLVHFPQCPLGPYLESNH